MPLILLTNDDGIKSPGLRAAAEALSGLGRLVVAAPSSQRTASGRSLMSDGPSESLRPVPFEVAGAEVEAYECGCSPALLVLHALASLLRERRPDLAVSGINYGENLGQTVTSSGTVGAALEAAGAGLPAMAVSLQTGVDLHYRYGEVDWRGAKHFTRLLAERVLERGLPPEAAALNVNVPDCAVPETPWRVTRLSRQSYFFYHLGSASAASRIGDAEVRIQIDPQALEPGSDIRAMALDRVVSITPLGLDLTARLEPGALGSLLGG
jgi:5'-nucleotidase